VNKVEAKKITTHIHNEFKNIMCCEEVDDFSNVQIWLKLPKREILHVARIVKDLSGRCVIVSAYQDNENYFLVYHFDIKGVVLNVEVNLKQDKNIESITPILRSANWTEREIKEMYNIEFLHHPNLNRLFLDESLDEGILDEYIPLSTAMNGASTCSMWEKINLQRESNGL